MRQHYGASATGSLRQIGFSAWFSRPLRYGDVVADLSLALLGAPVVKRDGARVTFDTKKAVALLAVLGVTGRDQSRDRLATLLWPESDTTHARGSLRRTLSVTAAAMGEGLVISRAAVALRPGGIRVDVADFESLAARPDVAALERAARL